MDFLLVAGVISCLWLKGILDVKINWMIMELLTTLVQLMACPLSLSQQCENAL